MPYPRGRSGRLDDYFARQRAIQQGRQGRGAANQIGRANTIFEGGGQQSRFRAKYISTKTISSMGYRHKRQRPGLTMGKLLRILNPTIKWRMFGTPHVSTSGTGLQGVSHIHILFSRTELRTIYNKLSRDASNPALQAIFGSGPANYLLGDNQDNTVTSGAVDYLPSLVCKNWTRVWTLSNPLTTVAYVEIWETQPKDDTGIGFVPTMDACVVKDVNDANGLTTTHGSYGLTMLPRNLQPPTTEQGIQYTDPGFRPWSTMKDLWSKYKVLKKTRIRLEPGSHTTFQISSPGFTVSQKCLYNAEITADEVYIKDLTILPVVFQIGERCYDNTAGNQPLSYMATTINWKFEDKCEFTIRPRGYDHYRFNTNAVAQFGDAFSSSNAYPIAALPTICVPSANVATLDVAPANMET